MNFDHDFGYSFLTFSYLLKKREEEKENELAKIVIKVHAFLLDLKKKFPCSIVSTVDLPNSGILFSEALLDKLED